MSAWGRDHVRPPFVEKNGPPLTQPSTTTLLWNGDTAIQLAYCPWTPASSGVVRTTHDAPPFVEARTASIGKFWLPFASTTRSAATAYITDRSASQDVSDVRNIFVGSTRPILPASTDENTR